MSMAAMIQFSASPATPGKTLPAKVTKIVFGSARLGSDSALAPSTTMKAMGMRV